ncbi:hypothetical protein HELRODRAFT_175843 [Helobdella robusta]|uniref:WAC domain-containing protein n=1 Tax=Helobdella robusta TaxID=6412 RepID=T1F9R5_HELRO|nr:hypothetical protein HELRODRAFT_175843 [Helobdella robusta]ESO00422.1 hypothetical protein HELRODRAFT_175843 [Helobdella robusta]
MNRRVVKNMKFFDQTILCNSLIWTCESTGHNNLTFLEAVESEGNSRKQINSFPRTLHLPILHLVSLTKRTIFKDLLDDIYGFTRDRYFIGEKVSILTETERKNAIVIKVFPVINLSGTGNNGLSNFVTEHEVNADGKKRIVIKSPKKAVIDSSLFQYMSQDVKTGTTIMSTVKNMNRNRNLFNRETCKLFLKEHCEHHCKGIWKLKFSAHLHHCDSSNNKISIVWVQLDYL